MGVWRHGESSQKWTCRKWECASRVVVPGRSPGLNVWGELRIARVREIAW